MAFIQHIDAIKAGVESDTDPQVEEAPAFDDDVKLDHDTEGVPGSPHIAETIEQKIDASAAFIADLTCVRQYTTEDGRKKRAQNANVLIELGLALRLKGAERILLVMNTAFGSPKNLPFDLRHYRKPITYSLKDPSDKAAVAAAKKELTDKLKTALKVMLKHIAANATAAEAASGQGRAAEQTDAFIKRLDAGDFHDLKQANIPFKVIGGPGDPDPSREAFLLLSIVPLKEPNPPLDIAAFEQRRPGIFRPIDQNGGISVEGYGTRIICHDGPRSGPRRGKEFPTSVIELNDDGCIFVGKRVLVWPKHVEGHDVVNLEMVERPMLRHLADYVILLRDLKVTGALEVRVILDGQYDAFISNTEPQRFNDSRYQHRQIRTMPEGPITLKPVTLSPKIDGNSVSEVAALMRRSLSVVWRDAGYPGDPCFDASQKFLPDAPP